MASFETVADEYDAGRPSYPQGVYDALGDITGTRVLDIGAGTGIATRQLRERGARLVAIDPGAMVLARAVAHSPDLAAVVADGVALPLGGEAADLVCFAQSWHWLDERSRVEEMYRVLRRHGRWAGWWSHAREDGADWFDEYWSVIERECRGTHRDQRDTDWGATIDRPGLFHVAERVVVPWVRSISVDDWLTDQASHSYVAALEYEARSDLLDRFRRILRDEYRSGTMSVRYETWLWIATKAP